MSDQVNVTEIILNKLNKIEDSVNETKVDISAIKVDLNYHIKRSDMNEARIEQVDENADKRITKLEKWSDKWHFVGWFITGLVGILIESGTHVSEFFKFWKH